MGETIITIRTDRKPRPPKLKTSGASLLQSLCPRGDAVRKAVCKQQQKNDCGYHSADNAVLFVSKKQHVLKLGGQEKWPIDISSQAIEALRLLDSELKDKPLVVDSMTCLSYAEELLEQGRIVKLAKWGALCCYHQRILQ